MTELRRILSFLDTGHLAGALILAVALLVTGIVLSRLIRTLLREALLHDKSERIDQITLSFLSHLAILFAWVLLLTLYAHLVPALHRLETGLLAGVGLVSIILGFAAQATLGNLVAGISLVLYRPFRRGDRLQVVAPVKGQFAIGSVQDITLGFTILKADSGQTIIIANGAMAQQTIVKLN